MNKPTIKRDAQEAALAATIVTIVLTAIEIPLLWVYLAVKWVAAFAGAMLGLWTVRLVAYLWKKAVARYTK